MTNRFISFKTRTCRTGGGWYTPRLSMIFTILYCTGFCLLAASCGDPVEDTILPPGKYPITFTASVQELAATRGVTSEGRWSVGERVDVKMRGVVKHYVVTAVDDLSNAKLSGADADNTFYWEASGKKESVSAMHIAGRWPLDLWKPSPHSFSFAVGLRQDQPWQGHSYDIYEASDFLYASSAALSFGEKESAKLSFYHQLARVVINIKEVEGGAASEITGVVLGYSNNFFTTGFYTPATEAGITQGLWTTLGTPGTVTPKKLQFPNRMTDGRTAIASYAALVIPGQNMRNKKFIGVSLSDGKTYYYTPLNLTDADFIGGKQHTYEITVKKKGDLVDLESGRSIWSRVGAMPYELEVYVLDPDCGQ